jgi:hypothetical protein
MTTDLVETWGQFSEVLKRYGKAYSLLNLPYSVEQIQAVEKKFNFELPGTLKSLLALNNGQQVGDEDNKSGIFKSVSGWNVYERHVFLGIEAIKTAYATFIQDPILVAEFGANEIPFAVAGSPTQFREAFCIHAKTGKVSLIWTQYVDPFNPPEWQVQKFKRGESLIQFIEKQIELYE